MSGNAEPDVDHLLRSNLERVFNQRDDAQRAAAVAELYVADPVMYEPDGIVEGRDAISATAGRLLVQSVHLEPGGEPEHVRAALHEELAEVTRWLGLALVEHRGAGDKP